MYSLGSFGVHDSKDDSEDTYGLGGGLQFKRPDGRGAVEAHYEMARSNPDGETVIAPAGYKTGAVDQTYGNLGSADDDIYGNSPSLRSSANIPQWSEDKHTAQTGDTSAYIEFTPAGNVDCDSDDLVAELGLSKNNGGRSVYVTCLGAGSDLDGLSDNSQPGSTTVDYMECVPDGRESPFATPEPVDTLESPIGRESTDISKSRWTALGKWMKSKGKGNPKKHNKAPSPSLDVLQLDVNVMLADNGSGRKPMDRGILAASLGGLSTASVDVDDVMSLAASSDQGNVLQELPNPCFVSHSLTQRASMTADKKKGLRFKSVHRSNPLAVAGEDDPTGEMSKTSTLMMDPKLGIRFQSMHRSNPLVFLGDSEDRDADEDMEDQESPPTVGSDLGWTDPSLGLVGGTMIHYPADELPSPMVSLEAGTPYTGPPRALTFTEEGEMLETEVSPTIRLGPLLRQRSTSYGTAIAEAEATDAEPFGTEATTRKTKDTGSRTWLGIGVGRFSKRISRRGGKDLNTPTNINSSTNRRQLLMSLEPDNVGRPMDTGYIQNGSTNPGGSIPAELSLPFDTLPDDDVDAEWDDIQQFLTSVVANADTVNHLGVEDPAISSYSPATGSRKRRDSRRSSLV